MEETRTLIAVAEGLAVLLIPVIFVGVVAGIAALTRARHVRRRRYYPHLMGPFEYSEWVRERMED